MLITEYNEQKEFEKERREGRREGIQEGIQQKSEAVTMELIRRGFSAEDVAAISGLPESTVKTMLEKQTKTIMAYQMPPSFNFVFHLPASYNSLKQQPASDTR